jgi:hypothetical protein
MASDEQHGFDVSATRSRVEEELRLFLPDDVTQESLPQAIEALVWNHWREHGVHEPIAHKGVVVSTPYCMKNPCSLLGLSLAWLEISAFETTSMELAYIRWLKEAENMPLLPESFRKYLLTRADRLEEELPLSRAVDNRATRRPRSILAQAVAQALREGGFTFQRIAKFMDAKVDATRRRCEVPGVSSLFALVAEPTANTNAEPTCSPVESSSD